jgi:hypothetical protein
MFTKFKSFLEANLADIFNSQNDHFDEFKNKSFVIDDNLIERIVLDKYDFKIINIKWNNYTGHSINDKIKTRTNFKSVSEFNEYFTLVIEDLFDNHFYELNREFEKYNIHLVNKNISIIIKFDYDDLFENDTTIEIKTIVNGFDSNVDEIIEINID